MDFLDRIYRRGKSSTLLSGAFMALLGAIFFGYGPTTVLGIVRLVGIVSMLLAIGKFVDMLLSRQADSALLTTAIVELVLGLVLTLSPDAFIDIVFVILGIAVAGLGATSLYLASHDPVAEGILGGKAGIAVGVVDIVLGIAMAVTPFFFVTLISVVAGLAMLCAGFTQIVAALQMPADPFSGRKQ